MPMNWPIPRIVACSHVQHSVSDSLQVKNVGKPKRLPSVDFTKYIYFTSRTLSSLGFIAISVGQGSFVFR